jgi:chromosome segregation ATPase
MELKQIQGELNDSKLQIAQISKEKSALASKIQNQELLKSKISDLELKLQRSEVQLEEMTKSRAECSEFFDNWNVWKNSLHDVFGNDIENIPKIVKHILDQKIESQNLLDQLQETHSNLQSTYSTNEQLKQLTNEHESNLKSLKQYIQDLESEKESVNIALFTANKRIESFNHLLNALETKNLDSLPDFDSKVDNETDKLLLKFQEVIV